MSLCSLWSYDDIHQQLSTSRWQSIWVLDTFFIKKFKKTGLGCKKWWFPMNVCYHATLLILASAMIIMYHEQNRYWNGSTTEWLTLFNDDGTTEKKQWEFSWNKMVPIYKCRLLTVLVLICVQSQYGQIIPQTSSMCSARLGSWDIRSWHRQKRRTGELDDREPDVEHFGQPPEWLQYVICTSSWYEWHLLPREQHYIWDTVKNWAISETDFD